jgi:hypothetical protein
MQNRAQLMMTIEQGGLIGKYYSHQWARRQILRQSDEDIEEQDKAIEEEQNDPKWAPPELPGAGGMSDGDQPVQDDQTTDQITPDDNDNDKIKALKQAMLVKKQMEEKGSENRSIQDESKYRSAIMLLSKNKQITDNLSI